MGVGNRSGRVRRARSRAPHAAVSANFQCDAACGGGNSIRDPQESSRPMMERGGGTILKPGVFGTRGRSTGGSPGGGAMSRARVVRISNPNGSPLIRLGPRYRSRTIQSCYPGITLALGALHKYCTVFLTGIPCQIRDRDASGTEW